MSTEVFNSSRKILKEPSHISNEMEGLTMQFRNPQRDLPQRASGLPRWDPEKKILYVYGPENVK